MTWARTGDLVGAAVEDRRCVLAFNVITLEHAEGILLGSARAGRPVILALSENAIRFHDGLGEPILRACAALLGAHEATASLHLDHIIDRTLLDLAREDLGVSSVMYDASAAPYDENLGLTREVTARLHDRGLWVEAELGAIGGKGGAHAPGVRTDPDEAAAFVRDTGVDALAVAVGSTHALTHRTAHVDSDLVGRIAATVPVPLVLHGSSGVPVEQLKEATSAGMRKINVGTALNVAFTHGVQAVMERDPDVHDPRKYLKEARSRLADVVEELLTAL